jgi:hypothetical protein
VSPDNSYNVNGEASSITGLPVTGDYNGTQAGAQNDSGIEQSNSAVQDKYGDTFVGGRVSTFGGPSDTGVTTTETGAITGENLRSLNPDTDHYVAFRWDYSKIPADKLRNSLVEVYNPETGKYVLARPIDWGPHGETTNKSVDTSRAVLKAIGAKDGMSNVYIRVVEKGNKQAGQTRQ